MEQLSFKKYISKCVLGGEIVYVICLFGGFLPLRTEAGTALHHAIFETMPGFTWISAGSVILGAAYVFIFSLVFGWYMVWMHNSSLEIKK